MKCYKCGKEKNITLFTKINRHKDNKVGLCKQCKYLQDKKYREEHKEHIAKMKKIYWQNDVNGIKKKNRDTIDKKRVGVTAEYLEDKVCEICGITNEECKKKYGCRLSIHHKDNNGRHNINNGKTPVHDNLQVLCNACHCRISNLTERDYSNWDKVLKKGWETRRKNERKDNL